MFAHFKWQFETLWRKCMTDLALSFYFNSNKKAGEENVPTILRLQLLDHKFKACTSN